MAVLAISRQFGAGGKTLGQRVAKRLGYDFVGEDMLQMVAEKANVSLKWVEGVQREAGGHLMRVLTTLVPSSFIDRHVGEDRSDFDEKRLAKFLTRVIEDLAREDNVVILGQGCQFILADDPKAVKILLVAEWPDRIKFMEDHYDYSPEKAKALVTSASRKRERFLGYFHKGDPNDPSLYHMVLNTSLIPLEAAEEQISELVLSVVDKVAQPIWD